jgi:hypothetical protein
MHTDVTFPDRFSAKLAIGLAHTILGPKATFSKYGDALRDRLWNRDANSQCQPALRGTGWWDTMEDARAKKLFNWPDGWTLATQGFNNAFGITLATPSGKGFSIMISDEPRTWQPDVDTTLLQGAAFVFIPQRSVALGPIPLIDYVSHRIGRRAQSALVDLEALRISSERLPPKGAKGLGNDEA